MIKLIKVDIPILVFWLIIGSILILAGCNEANLPQPEIMIPGTNIWFIPEGTNIGEMEAPENGIYMGQSHILEAYRNREQKNNL